MGTVAAGVDLLVTLLEQGLKISQILQTAQAAGQTVLTPEQWAIITGGDDSAEAALLAAIARMKA